MYDLDKYTNLRRSLHVSLLVDNSVMYYFQGFTDYNKAIIDGKV